MPLSREELQDAFEQAKAAGDFENAYKIEQQLNSTPVDYKFSQSVKNFPSSAANLLGEMWQAVRHPVETGKAIGGIAQDFGDKLGRWAAEDVARQKGLLADGESYDVLPEHSEARADAAADFYKGRYGSLDAIKQTAMDDPAGMMLDVSGSGSATRIPVLAKAAHYIDPINTTARAAQTASKIIPKNAAARLYDSAAKFSNRQGFDRNAVIETALREGIVPTSRGVRRVQDRVQILDSTLDDLVREAGESGMKIPVSAIEKHLDQLRRTKGGFRLGRGKDLEKIDKLLEQWHKDLADLGGGSKITHVSPEFVQAFKENAWRDVSWKAKRAGAKQSQVQEDFYKAMGRGAKDAVVDAVPEASEINKLLGELLELQPELTSAAGRIDKHNILGLDASIKTGAGAAIGAGADAAGLGGGLGMAISLLGNPRVKPRIAIALKRLRDGDVKWIDQNLGDPAVRAAIVLAGRANEIVGAPTYGAE